MSEATIRAGTNVHPTSREIGNAILALAPAHAFNPLTVNKLAYLAYGRWSLKDKGPLCLDGPVAGKYGPSMAELHDAMRKHRGMSLEGPVGGWLRRARTLHLSETERLETLKAVVEDCKGMGELRLSTICHTRGSAWDLHTDGGRRGPEHDRASDDRIPDATIAACFARDPGFGYREDHPVEAAA